MNYRNAATHRMSASNGGWKGGRKKKKTLKAGYTLNTGKGKGELVGVSQKENTKSIHRGIVGH